MGKGKGKRDPMGDFVEWQEHQYQDGYYYNRGKVPPIYRGKNSPPPGFLLLVTGTLSLIGLALYVLANGILPSNPSWQAWTAFWSIVTVLQFAVGIKFMQEPARKRRRH